MLNSQKLRDAEAMRREEALKLIAALVRRYELLQGEVLQIWADSEANQARDALPPAKRFDPFFHAW